MNTGPADLLCNTDMVATKSDIYVDSGIKYTIDNHESNVFPISTTCEKPVRKQTRYTAQTPEWIVQRVRHDDIPRAITVLRTWVPLSREREISKNLVRNIRKLRMADAVDAINSLKDKRKFIRGTKGKDLKISVVIENISNHNQIETLALLDSGATGSCVNKSFVEKHGLMVKKLPIKIPIYNADGSLNNSGSVEGFWKSE